MELQYFKSLSEKFQRLLVEAKCKKLGCFYLSENLNQYMDYIFQSPEPYSKDGTYDQDQSLATVSSYQSITGLYREDNFCWYFGDDSEKGQCTIPDAFSMFAGLLESFSHNDSNFNNSHSSAQSIPNFRYRLKKRYDRGSYGEVWLAIQWNCSLDGYFAKDQPSCNDHQQDNSFNCENLNANSSGRTILPDPSYGQLLILKRIMVERGNSAHLSGLREKYFGELFLNVSKTYSVLKGSELSKAFAANILLNSSYSQNRNTFIDQGIEHIARFIESFESESSEIWLVFQNEGISLSKLIYTFEEKNIVTNNNDHERVRHFQVLQPSKWWYWMRTTQEGHKQMQNIVYQLLLALKACHDRNITHRDIKPENMIICFEDVETGKCLREMPTGTHQNQLNLRIIDFGSAIDDFTLKHLFGSGPTRSEQTFEYTPPEALLNVSWFQQPNSVRLKYDIWSVGVVMLELILGTPHVFQIRDHARILMDRHLEGWSEHTKELAYKLKSYMDFCILIPGTSPHHYQAGSNQDQNNFKPASWKCSEESFSQQVKARDPLKMGFPNIWALQLVRKLLVWHPEDRLSVEEALDHPYFRNQP